MPEQDDYKAAFVATILETLRRSIGRSVVSVMVEEMAFYGPEEAPYFSDPALTFVQATCLELAFSAGPSIQFTTAQNDDSFSLWAGETAPEDRLAPSLDPTLTWFRVRSLPEFPLGTIDTVEWGLDDDGDMQEAVIRIAGQVITLRAGEVYEDWDGSLTVHDRDESVLIFHDPQTYKDMVFGARVYRIPDDRRQPGT